MDLKSRLFAAADAWLAAHDAPPSRLGKRVAGDANYFERLKADSASTTTATLTKFAQFFADAGNWPDGRVPAEAVEFAHVNGVSVERVEAATGRDRDLSGYANTALTAGSYMTRGGQ